MAKKTKGVRDSDAAGDEIDAIQLLTSQHREVDKLFQDLKNASDETVMRSTLLQVVDKLTAHTTIEERHFYPVVRGAETEDIVADAFDDHHEVKEMCLHLLDVGPGDEDFHAKVEELQALVEEHVAIEEGELFPQVRELYDVDQLQTMGREMAASLAELEEIGEPRQQLIADLGEDARK